MVNKFLFIILTAFVLTACTTTSQQLQTGKASFESKDYKTAFEKLKPLAEKGNDDAQYAVGYMYYYGKGTKPDVNQAKYWIRKAAEQGQPQAQKAARLLI